MTKQDAELLEPIRAARNKIQAVVNLLRANDLHGWAEFLERKLANMEGWYGTKEALLQIGEVCHVKALGDQYLNSMTWDEWLARISELKSVCAQAFNELESLGTSNG